MKEEYLVYFPDMKTEHGILPAHYTIAPSYQEYRVLLEKYGGRPSDNWLAAEQEWAEANGDHFDPSY